MSTAVLPTIFVALASVDETRPEPEVLSHIEAARGAVARSPRSAEARGELAMTLHAHGLHDEAYEAFLEAAELDAADHRWPYLAALTDPPPELALRHLERAYVLEPDDVGLAVAFGAALLRDGRLDNARIVYGRLPRNAAAGEHAALGLARIDLLEGRIDRALERLEDQPLSGSRNADVHRLLAIVRSRGGDEPGAAKAAFRARSYGYGRRPISPVVDTMQAHGVSVGAVLDRARRLAERGSVDEARSLLESVASRDPTGDAHCELGLLALERGNGRGAVAHFEAALASSPDHAGARVGRSRARIRMGDVAAVEEELLAVLNERPGHAAAHRELGRLTLIQGRYDVSVEHYRSALRVDPRSYLDYADLAAAHEGAGETRSAIEARRKLVLLEPGQVENLRALSRLEIAEGELDAATETLRILIGESPTDTTGAFNLAMLLSTRSSSDPETAARDAAEALELALGLYRSRRHDAACADLVGLAYAAGARFEEATRTALRARELAGGDASLRAAIDEHLASYRDRRPVTVPRLR